MTFFVRVLNATIGSKLACLNENVATSMLKNSCKCVVISFNPQLAGEGGIAPPLFHRAISQERRAAGAPHIQYLLQKYRNLW